ncbi:MAG: hypothetical protein P1Q69_06385 [Candidatus Thorarchaeota archaeon]|nr:hypothetical protein [Candidatus Thorarchaeota archaeon]
MRKVRITAKHLQLLIALQEGPLDRLEELAKRVNMSRTTVAHYLKWLSGEDSSSEKRYFRVVPDFDEGALDLQTVDVFFETPSFQSVKDVEELCYLHPYTKFRARCYSGNSEVFAQFRIPTGSENLLDRFFRESKRKGKFTNYRILPTENVPSLFTVPRLEFWDNESFTWNFDWDEWTQKPGLAGRENYKQESTSKLEYLCKNDIALLRFLSNGMRRKQRFIIEELRSQGISLSSQEFSRHFKFLRENFIPRSYVYIDIDAFDLYSNVVLTADSTNGFSTELRRKLLSNPIPFHSTLKATDSYLFWYLRLPPSHLSTLLYYLHERVDNLRVSMIDHEKSKVYGLWSEAFDETKKVWRIDTDFLLCRNSE